VLTGRMGTNSSLGHTRRIPARPAGGISASLISHHMAKKTREQCGNNGVALCRYLYRTAGASGALNAPPPWVSDRYGCSNPKIYWWQMGTIGGYPNTGEMWWGIIIAPCTSSTEKQEPGQQCIYSLQRRKLQITNYDRQHSSKSHTIHNQFNLF